MPSDQINAPLPIAKWCGLLKDGIYVWDKTMIKCFLTDQERQDPVMVGRLLSETTISGRLHPLIFQTSSATDSDTVRLRSLPFLRHMQTDGASGLAHYKSLATEQKRIVAVGVRDLYLAAWRGLLNESDRKLLDSLVSTLDETVVCVHARGMEISFHPSADFKVVKLIESLDDTVGEEWLPYFAQVMDDNTKLFAVFVNPAELSLHNFENVIPLDRWIESKVESSGLVLSLTAARRVQADRGVVTCKLQGSVCGLLKQLASLDLYIAPMNKATRGGERFIFHSARLSKALSHAVRSSDVLGKLSDGIIASSPFEFVNYVFRCNRFAPGDSKFTKHLDTPYYDSSRSHVSKYTLLIYLTGGAGAPALRVQDVAFDEIDEMTCIIFDQSYAHEGRPFDDSDKIFIRSELVFEDKTLAHNSQITSLFSTACYMTGQSVFDQELALYAHECFERANSLHWAIEREAHQPPVYLHKSFKEMEFITNGYDYWFSNAGGAELADCGVITGQPFRSLCSSNVWPYLMPGCNKESEGLFKKKPDSPFVKRTMPGWYYEGDFAEENDALDPCCPFHHFPTFDAWQDGDVKEMYKRSQKYTRKDLVGVPLLILNQELMLNESNITIQGDKIYFVQGPDGKSIPPVNFAACWNGPPPAEFVGVSEEISALRLLIPPITIQRFDQGYHLMLDFFRNDWMVRVDDEYKISIPFFLPQKTSSPAPMTLLG
ncbi:hypothetical protein EDB81DRAFT_848140 [Dactylonectria macrodidyma]|uniref:Uncharacterized protein n=1 Tax=Dactylonectria macrodidyma TaxID=307937 RepID=A0A9P9DFR9_9HYPO|nr:hypothetical protein EDB81DRAFT_848140 [Dactylonectria macrodidyma]